MSREQADAIRYQHATRGATPRVASKPGRRGPLKVTPEAVAQMRAVQGVRDAVGRARDAYNAALTEAGQGYPGTDRVNMASLTAALASRAEDWAIEHPDADADSNPGVRAIRTAYETVSRNIIQRHDDQMWTRS
jgi:hypothetical protein